MKKLITSTNRTQMYLFKSILEDEGIACFIKNEYPPAAGELPPISATPELWVIDDNHYQQAMAIIQENQPPSRPMPSWICTRCGEKLEGQFTACWCCGTPKS